MQIEIEHRPQDSRYVVYADGREASFGIYRRSGQRVDIPYTEVAVELEGRGIGSALVKAMLDDMRGPGVTIVPTCSFVASYIASNPEYAGAAGARAGASSA